jgi:hypothetical protein
MNEYFSKKKNLLFLKNQYAQNKKDINFTSDQDIDSSSVSSKTSSIKGFSPVLTIDTSFAKKKFEQLNQ